MKKLLLILSIIVNPALHAMKQVTFDVAASDKDVPANDKYIAARKDLNLSKSELKARHDRHASQNQMREERVRFLKDRPKFVPHVYKESSFGEFALYFGIFAASTAVALITISNFVQNSEQ